MNFIFNIIIKSLATIFMCMVALWWGLVFLVIFYWAWRGVVFLIQ